VTTESVQSVYLHRQRPIVDMLTITYTFLAYIGGIFFCTLASLPLNLLGFSLLTHSLVYSAYLSHELMHGTIFKSRQWNVRFGAVLLWINGGCYFGFNTLTLQHIAHHVKHVDVFTFDIPVAIERLPRIVRTFVLTLEWFYFPVVGFWSRWRSLLTPFWNSAQKERIPRIVCLLLIRGTLFVVFGMTFPKAIGLYFLAYIGMITVLRWMDAFQHTYEAFPVGSSLPKRDRDYEQAHTYSPLISRRLPWLNILVLNFGYHNAHHLCMQASWYHLPKIHTQFCQDPVRKTISIGQQIVNYHRFRIKRLVCGQGDVVTKAGEFALENFFGATDVSFLMLY
jgi:fatty acid desaturase